MKILERCLNKDVGLEREVYWIAKAKRLGWPITNATDGGLGARGHTRIPAVVPKRFRRLYPYLSPSEAIKKAGGRKELMAIFASNGKPVSKQAVAKWVKLDHLPLARNVQLAMFKPEWFGR
jgi:hypothetical protein